MAGCKREVMEPSGREKVAAAAALDVVSTEPIRSDNPLLQAKNCILTPHISWAPIESRQRILDCTIRNVRQFLSGTPENNVWQ